MKNPTKEFKKWAIRIAETNRREKGLNTSLRKTNQYIYILKALQIATNRIAKDGKAKEQAQVEKS